jgi:hypothetical protein
MCWGYYDIPGLVSVLSGLWLLGEDDDGEEVMQPVSGACGSKMHVTSTCRIDAEVWAG